MVGKEKKAVWPDEGRAGCAYEKSRAVVATQLPAQGGVCMVKVHLRGHTCVWAHMVRRAHEDRSV